jgi:hypothetical protein
MTVGQLVSVEMVFDHSKKNFFPRKLLWNKKVYPIDKIALRHPIRQGRNLSYIFSVMSGELYMRMKFDTDNLFWYLEEVDDGQS